MHITNVVILFFSKIKTYTFFEKLASFVGCCKISAEITMDYVGLSYLTIGLVIQSTPVHLSALCSQKKVNAMQCALVQD